MKLDHLTGEIRKNIKPMSKEMQDFFIQMDERTTYLCSDGEELIILSFAFIASSRVLTKALESPSLKYSSRLNVSHSLISSSVFNS